MDSNSATFECHLWSSKVASAKIIVAAFFISLALGTVVAPLIRSSTYIFLFILRTISGRLELQVSKCFSMTPPNKKGEGPKSNRALAKRSVSTSLVSMFFNQWNLRASLSSGLILTCKNAFLISPVMAIGLKRPRINTLHSWFL